MPNVNISIETIAATIKHMNKRELETLALLLTDEGKEILKRKNDIQNKRIKTISRNEAFDV